jgi:starch phosphorylase
VTAFSIAYFSMEVGFQSDLPTYSGGLGVLAGDTLRAAADFGLSMVGVTLVHRKGTSASWTAGTKSKVPPVDPSTRLEPCRCDHVVLGRQFNRGDTA